MKSKQLYIITWLFSRRFILMLTVVIALTTSLGMWYLSHNYVAKANQVFTGIYNDYADLYVSVVDDKVSSYRTAMGVVSMSNNLRDNIFRNNVSRSEMVMLGRNLAQNISETTFLLYKSQEVISHWLYTYLPADGYYFKNIKDVQNKEWFESLKMKSPQFWYHYSNVTDTNHLTIAEIIYNYDSTVGTWGQGYCCQTITVDTATLFKPFEDTEMSIYIFDNKTGSMIYDYSPNLKEKGKEAIQKQYNAIYEGSSRMSRFPSRISLINDNGIKGKYTVVTRNIGIPDATAVILFNLKQVEQSDSAGLIYGAIIILFCMMFLLTLSSLVYNKRLNKLIDRMDHFDEKDEMLPEPIEGSDELARIDRHLLRMQGRVRTLIQNEYTAKMQVMAAQQEALMACINPHFLYNTLNTISAMACVEGADSTSEMVGALSDMFRYSSDVSRQHVALREELNNISDYLYIQSIRYQNTFTYSIDIDQSFYEYQIPKLVLQPIIENAFKHGFKNQITEREGDRQLLISAEKDDTDLIISIKDNGKGITAEKLAFLQGQIAEGDTKINAPIKENGSIGILNVHQRIRLRYGPGYGLKLMSEGEGKGVHVIIRVPCIMEQTIERRDIYV
ncbi:MAG: sensor histidine kinase [Herbinix sp.]|nr:sensor histidine kinase [Herbinix sp.]